MKWLKVIAASFLALLTGVAAVFIKSLRDRVREAEEDARMHRQAITDIIGAAAKARQAAEDIESAGRNADNERKALNATPDSGLIDRANKLFP
jgi:hypothetical protein